MTTDMTTTPSAPSPGTIARQEFGAQQLTVTAETASTSIAAMMQATVQARLIVAQNRPRDLDDVRTRIMRRVDSPGFAETAWFRKPIGAGVEGFSVRFTDMAAQALGNLLEEASVMFEDAYKRVVRVSVTDLEANLTKFKDVVLEKTVERRNLNDGRVALSVRKNSRGEPTYTVGATEDELLAKEGALCSKIRRNLILQILPGDIQDAAQARILEIRHGAAPKDPEAAKRKVVDSFSLLNVMPSDLKTYLGHDVATCSPNELQELRDVYASIASGEVAWIDALNEKRPPKEEGAPAPPKPGLEGVRERLKGAAKPPADAPAATTTEGGDELVLKPEGKK
jgi:hypothetical protein